MLNFIFACWYKNMQSFEMLYMGLRPTHLRLYFRHKYMTDIDSYCIANLLKCIATEDNCCRCIQAYDEENRF